MKRLIASLVFSSIAFACGGDNATSAPDASADAASTDAMAVDAGDSSTGGDAGIDNGEASTTYPAYRPPVPQIPHRPGGTVVASPKIRLVFFAGETRVTH